MSRYIESVDGKVTGFNMITTARYEGFSSRILSEFEIILNNLSNSDKVHTVIDYYTKLYNHIHDPAGHDINYMNYKKELISQLYRIYRELNYTGSTKDMVLGVVKDIEVGTDKDVAAGISDTKAMNVVQWKPIFDRHLESMSAHYRIYETLNPDNAFRARPTYHLSVTERYFDANPTDSEYATPSILWNNSAYTLEVRYRLSPTDRTIFSIKNTSNTLDVKQENYTLTFYLNGTKVAELATNAVLQKDHIVISFTKKEAIFAANLDVTIVNLADVLDDAHLVIPNGLTHTGVYQLTYYPVAANDDEIRFLLN